MNPIRLGLNIYNKPWLIEPNAALRMLDEWDKIRESGSGWNYKSFFRDEDDSEDRDAVSALFRQQDVIYAPDDSYSLSRFEGFTGAKVAVITIDGPLMKGDYCGSLGTESIAQLVKLAARTQSVEEIILKIDSPGGTVNGTQTLANVVKNCGKHTIAYVDGMMCSAAYWIGSACDEVVAGAETDIIGSIGTMISWYDYSETYKQRGIVLREYYATQSSDKNKMMRDAEQGNGKMLIAEMLDPLNNVFLAAVKSNRENVSEAALTGKTYTAQNAISMGLIDKIQSLDTILKNALKGNKPKQSFMAKDNLSFQHVMTAAEATELAVAEGGFLMTEDQLNKVDAALANAGTAATTAADQIAKLTADLNAAKDSTAQLQTKLEASEKEAKDLKAASKSFFGKDKGAQDPEQHATGAESDDEVFAMVGNPLI